jgi:DNA-binding MarR family transcriptional regulator
MVERSTRTASAKAGWLNDGERRAWLAYVDASTLLDDHLNRQLRRDSGLTHADYTLLAHLSTARDAALSMSELARRLKITRSRLTHAVARLEQSGYVSRSGHAPDRRTQLAALTSTGRAALEQAAPGHVAAVRRAVFDVLTPAQVRHLAEIGDAIVQALEQVDETEANPDTLPWRRR